MSTYRLYTKHVHAIMKCSFPARGELHLAHLRLPPVRDFRRPQPPRGRAARHHLEADTTQAQPRRPPLARRRLLRTLNAQEGL